MTIKFAIIFIFLAWLTAWPVYASARLDFQTVDMLTYRCYNEQKWDSVILVGKQALRQKIDYYYLRVRMGIAYYEKHEYFSAAIHLEKARQFNSGDPFVNKHLYWAYMYTNRNEEANLFEASLPAAERDTTGSKPGFLEQVHFETGFTLSSDRAPKNLQTLMGKDSIYGEQDLYGNSIYEDLSLNLRVSNRLGFTLAYNFLNFNKTKYIQNNRGPAHFDSIADTSYNYHMSQHEAHIAVLITLPWGLKVMPAFHWIYVSYTMINTLFRPPSGTTLPPPPFTRKDTTYNNFLAALEISKDIGRFNIALSGSWSNLNGMSQEQAGLALTYYPLGNLSFYGTTAATGFFQSTDSRLLLSQALGGKFTSWLWGEVNFYYGDYTNANIFNGSIVYNNSDIVDYRAGATLNFIVSRHIQLSLIYQYFRKESQQIYYTKTQDPMPKPVQQTKNNPYYTNTLIGGITWKL